jgi:hypothetical protein
MMTITYEAVYYADRRHADPPAGLRAHAEANAEYLLQTRVHRFVTSTNAFGTFALTRAEHVPSSQGWIVTYSPAGSIVEPAAVAVVSAPIAKKKRQVRETITLDCQECGKVYRIGLNNTDPECPKCGGTDYEVRS